MLEYITMFICLSFGFMFNNYSIKGETFARKIYLSPPLPLTSATVRSKAVVLLLLIHCLFWLLLFVFVACFVIYLIYFIPFLVLKSCRSESESYFLKFHYVLALV